MITLALARDLLRHMQWADAEIWRALDATPGATSDEKLMTILRHLHVVQRAFYLMWNGGEIEWEVLETERDPDTLRQWARTCYPDADAFIARTEPPALSDIVVMPWLPTSPNGSAVRCRLPLWPTHSCNCPHTAPITEVRSTPASASSVASRPSSTTSPGCGSEDRSRIGELRAGRAQKPDRL